MNRYIDADKVLYFFPDDMDPSLGEDYARGWNHCKELCIKAVETVCDIGFIHSAGDTLTFGKKKGAGDFK